MVFTAETCGIPYEDKSAFLMDSLGLLDDTAVCHSSDAMLLERLLQNAGEGKIMKYKVQPLPTLSPHTQLLTVFLSIA